MIVRNCMKRKVFFIHVDDTVAGAAKLMHDYHIGLLPVVDNDKILIGILTLHSLLRITLPDFIDFISNFSFLNNLGAFETRVPSADELNIQIKKIMDDLCILSYPYLLASKIITPKKFAMVIRELHVLHQKNMCHRDVRLANIVFGVDKAMLIDYDMAGEEG